MNIALILAGGVGMRTGMVLPKQFLPILGKPLLVYTIEIFEKHPEIDVIAVSIHKDWLETLHQYIELYGFQKIRCITIGGDTRHASTKQGLLMLEKTYVDDDIVLIQDGVRPLTPAELISQCIRITREDGSAFAVTPAVVPILVSRDGKTSDSFLLKEQAMQSLTPTAMSLRRLLDFYASADEQHLIDYPGLGEAVIAAGQTLRLVESDPNNIKIVRQEDIASLTALLQASLD